MTDKELIDTACSQILNMPIADAAKILEIPITKWESMTIEQKDSYAYDTFKYTPEILKEFLDITQKGKA